jgi:catalase
MGQRLELGKEYPPLDEQKHIDSLIGELRGKMERDYAKNRILRDAHPKMHGCVRGELAIEPNLPEELRIGIFSQSRRFPVWIRFSNQSGSVSPDSKGDIRGVALKLMGVDGEKLLPNETQGSTHDFILISDSRFVTKDVAEFDGLVKALTGGALKMLWFFLTHPRAARNLWVSLKRFSNPLEIRYFSVAAYLLGRKAVKYSLTPRDAQETPLPVEPSDDYLKEAMAKQLSSRGAAFDFAVQFQADAYTMPIEDPGVTWDEAVSPFRKVATLTISSQVFDTAERREFGDNLSFNPWRCLPEHRPLGGISRARRQVYQALSIFRHERNQATRVEPTVNDKEWMAGA